MCNKFCVLIYILLNTVNFFYFVFLSVGFLFVCVYMCMLAKHKTKTKSKKNIKQWLCNNKIILFFHAVYVLCFIKKNFFVISKLTKIKFKWNLCKFKLEILFEFWIFPSFHGNYLCLNFNESYFFFLVHINMYRHI